MQWFFEKVNNELVFIPELGIGHYPVPTDNRPYGEIYFDRYVRMSSSIMGEELTKERISFVERHYTGFLLDVGIGSGQFVESRNDTFGYDVNPSSIKWLREKQLWMDLYDRNVPAISFWDSLEHIDRPDIAVSKSSNWVFLSIPIFESGDAILHSKHFRKDEHIWYFTDYGIINWFHEQGFECREHNYNEIYIGREGIGSYAFQRRK